MAALYDGFRVDHLVGFFRTYGRPAGRRRRSSIPADEPAQIAQGEADSADSSRGQRRARSSPRISASMPDFVRASIARLGVPGCKVLRWERDWDAPGIRSSIRPTTRRVSAAMTGTHDTETLAGWWDQRDTRRAAGRARAARVLRARGLADADAPWSDALRDALARPSPTTQAPTNSSCRCRTCSAGATASTCRARSSEHNWTWRLPWPVDRLSRRARGGRPRGVLPRAGRGRRASAANRSVRPESGACGPPQ